MGTATHFRKTVLSPVACIAFAAGCGSSSYLELSVETDLVNTDRALVVGATDDPDDVEVDVLRVDLLRAGEDPFATRSFDLSANDHAFPLTISMEPVAATPNPVSVHVTAFWEDVEVAAGGVADVRWKEGVISTISVGLGVP